MGLLLGSGRSGERERLLCCCGYSGDDTEVSPAITPPSSDFQDARSRHSPLASII